MTTAHTPLSLHAGVTAPVTVVGCVQIDLVLTPVAELPAPGASAFVDDMSLRVGGAGANTALAFAEVDVPARLVGCVGDDLLGRWILDQLAPSGLDADISVDPGRATGLTVACEAPQRDRTFITFLGVTADTSVAMVPAGALAAGHVVVCDYFCTPRLRGAPTRELLAAARANDAATYFDTAWDPDGFAPETRAELRELLPQAERDVRSSRQPLSRASRGSRSYNRPARAAH